MQKHEQTKVQLDGIGTYVTGFILSLLLTIMPFLMVYYHTVSGTLLVAAIVCFAILQLFVQLVFFLHLGNGRDGRWNIMAFLFMAMVVVIIVIGSLWIMYNLNYHMTPTEVEERLIKDQGF
ncbi:MAG TPA: cytochrome o ubiquinol oxidase subunit IV [Candidatus Saccharimonadales bacterium]|nr:cytochrome o ubiquinol oxidase subunit IV [Candidatus Saccharimonadales bacterium]